MASNATISTTTTTITTTTISTKGKRCDVREALVSSLHEQEQETGECFIFFICERISTTFRETKTKNLYTLTRLFHAQHRL